MNKRIWKIGDCHWIQKEEKISIFDWCTALKWSWFQDCLNNDQRFAILIGQNWISKYLIQEKKCEIFDLFIFFKIFQIIYKKVNKKIKIME